MIEYIIISIKKQLLINNNKFNNNLLEYYNNKKTINSKLKENVYELTGIIYFLLDNFKKYQIGININKKPDKNLCNYRKKKLSIDNLYNFEYCLKTNNININFNKNKLKEINRVYLIFTQNIHIKGLDIIDYIIDDINIITLTQLYGIENFNILKHINYKRHEELVNTKEGQHSIKELTKYKNLLKNQYDIINNFIVLSSMLLFTIGTTTALDVDILIYNKNNNSKIQDLSLKMGEAGIDYNIYDNTNSFYSHEYKRHVYWMTQAFSYDWVSNSGAEEFEDFYFNSKFYFYMHGIKYVSLRMQIERLIRRNSNYAYVDLIALTIHNKVNLSRIKPNFCVGRLRLRQGIKSLLTEDDYNEMMNVVVKYLKLWHNKTYTLEEITNILPFCIEKPFDKYIRKTNFEVLFNNLRRYHQFIKLYFLKKYCNNGILIDIGSSHLKNIKFWKQLRLSKIISLEPSETLYNEGLIRLSKDNFAKKYITFIRAAGEKLWSNGDAGLNTISKKQIKEIVNIKVDSITFEFTIHYMIYNSKILMENLKQISKKGTIVVIHCLNGNLIQNSLLSDNKLNIYKNNDIVFTIEKKYTDSDEFKEISVYFKNVQGLENNVNEYLILNKFIINLFKSYNFNLIEYVSFIEHFNNEFYLATYELEITKLYITYIFKMD